MNLELFTDRAKGFLQSAQTVAIRLSHQRIAPEHLLKALLDHPQALFHFCHADKITIQRVPVCSGRDFEIQTVIDQIRVGLTNVISNAGRP